MLESKQLPERVLNAIRYHEDDSERLIGWIALVGYAAYGDAGKEMVTRDYVRYMTSNSILVGAEIDKVVTIMTVTAIVALAIFRARKLMVKAFVEAPLPMNCPVFSHRKSPAASWTQSIGCEPARGSIVMRLF